MQGAILRASGRRKVPGAETVEEAREPGLVGRLEWEEVEKERSFSRSRGSVGGAVAGAGGCSAGAEGEAEAEPVRRGRLSALTRPLPADRS